MPDSVLLLDLARAGHLTGIACGLGLALVADLVALRSFLSPVGSRDVWMLRCLHRIILGGLALLWVSGLYILWIRTGFDIAQFSPKLVVKLAVVTLLSLNALMIGSWALPRYARLAGLRFGDFPMQDRLRLSTIAGVSLSCWLSALALGVFSQLKVMDFATLQMIFAPLFLTAIAGALAMGLGARTLARLTEPRDWAEAPALGRVHSRMLGM
ncbi:MAG: hypothetical protein KDK24_09735 [Pseudooceanicola sp.]|nr:hypothetical protein [Pseudooceanicola sp.]